MGITVIKKKGKTQSKVKPKLKSGTSDYAAVLDPMGILSGQISIARKTLKLLSEQYDELYEEFIDSYDEDNNPTEKSTETTKKFRAKVGAHGNKTTIDDVVAARKALNKVQKGLGNELMKFDITALKQYLSIIDLEDILSESPENKRQIKFEEL